jgi:hypothetical protein
MRHGFSAIQQRKRHQYLADADICGYFQRIPRREDIERRLIRNDKDVPSFQSKLGSIGGGPMSF